MKRRQVMALCASIIYLLTLIFSVSFIAAQTDHEHISGEDCIICTTLRDCAERLHAPDAAPKTGEDTQKRGESFVLSLLPAVRRRDSRRATPVSLRVKLTN